MPFKLSREQLAKRHALADELREKARALNIAIAVFNQGVEPLAQTLGEAQDAYNATLEATRSLANSIAEPAQAAFDAKSQRWQDGDKGSQVGSWIEQWEMNLDDIDLERPEPLEEIDPDAHAAELAAAPGSPAELEDAPAATDTRLQ
jgi:hypothetical protein